jgi:hypothetical protein
MGSGVVIHVPSFVKIGSGIQRLLGGIHRHTHRLSGLGNEIDCCSVGHCRLLNTEQQPTSKAGIDKIGILLLGP